MDVHRTTLSEEQVLAYFAQAARDVEVDRLALLRQLSVVAIARPDGWNYADVRAANPWDIPGLDAPSQCFGCYTGSRRLYWHHVIAVDHGGSASLSNLVALCYRCHRTVHPWMPERRDADEQARGPWSTVREVVEQLATGTFDPGPPRPQVYDDEGHD